MRRLIAHCQPADKRCKPDSRICRDRGIEQCIENAMLPPIEEQDPIRALSRKVHRSRPQARAVNSVDSVILGLEAWRNIEPLSGVYSKRDIRLGAAGFRVAID